MSQALSIKKKIIFACAAVLMSAGGFLVLAEIILRFLPSIKSLRKYKISSTHQKTNLQELLKNHGQTDTIPGKISKLICQVFYKETKPY